MAFEHFIRKSRDVRLGGWRIGPLRFGGGMYTAGPLSVIRWAQFCQASIELNETPADVTGIAARHPQAILRALVPVLIEQPIAWKHLRRASPHQLGLVFAAFGEVNDLDYCTKALTGEGEDGKKAESDERTGLEVLAVSLAERLHVGDPHEVLTWPMQEVLAICDALKTIDKEFLAAREPKSDQPHEVDDLALDLKRLGIVVS